MSVTFTKLFSSITESTVWCEPDRTRLVWITMLAMADKRGRVWASVPGLANRARVPVDDARKAIATFLGPDPDSRTDEWEGRRIEVIEGGWRLLNHAKYRAIRDEEAILESKRKYINTRRAIEHVDNVDRGRHNAEAEADTEAKGKSTTTALAAKPLPPKKNGISFDWPTYSFQGIQPADMERWQEAYPAIPVPDEIERAAAWLQANPANRKSNYTRFLINWFSRSQDKAGRIK